MDAAGDAAVAGSTFGDLAGTLAGGSDGFVARFEAAGVPSVTTQPVSQTVVGAHTATFSAGASGTPTPTVQWQVSTNGGSSFTDIPGATSATYSFTADASQDGDQYRAVFTNSGGAATSNAATLTVTVDATPPVISTSGNQTVEATGPAGAPVSFSPTATDDIDGAISVSCTPASGSTFPIATTTVTCTATDVAGNTGTAQILVTVQDTTPPAIAAPATVAAEATTASGGPATWTATATDLVSGTVPVVCTPASGSTFPTGTTPVTCTATDAKGNSATATIQVIVADTTAPLISAPASVTAEATGPAGAVATYAATASDAVDGTLPVSCTPASGTTFPLGTTNVSCTATDNSGNTTTSTIPVHVVDTTPPTMTTSGDMTVEATQDFGTNVDFTATATDLVDGATDVTCLPHHYTLFPLGSTQVVCTSTDSHGNTASASLTITVVDTTPPDMGPPTSDQTLDATSPAGAVATFVSGAFDMIDNTSEPVTCTPASGSVFPIGTTTVTCTAQDHAGNVGSTSFTVTVIDQPPVVTVPADISGVQATSLSGTPVAFTASATDAVDGPLTSVCAPASGSGFPVGTTTVTCTATDSGGHQGSGKLRCDGR